MHIFVEAFVYAIKDRKNSRVARVNSLQWICWSSSQNLNDSFM